jgi:hypothetical protein
MVPLNEIFADVMVDVPRVPCPHIWDPSDIGDERVVSAVGPDNLRRPEGVPAKLMIEV